MGKDTKIVVIERMSLEEYKKLKKEKRALKMRNKICWYEGIRFHSEGELGRWHELKILEKSGELRQLARQPIFMFKAGFTYTADFQYNHSGKYVVEDFKGRLTAHYIDKKKLFIDEYLKTGKVDIFRETFKTGHWTDYTWEDGKLKIQKF